ncbi:patatin-like phospholipase family protein [Dyella sp. C11]|uniref:patatin-like phospholipase family protein n=1 Tax=Dyella sp. C11 TaxID=2126991 RepID=UPI000D64AA0E|nr:patatin-like phospholipase family protein [Dyella sp. C11]
MNGHVRCDGASKADVDAVKLRREALLDSHGHPVVASAAPTMGLALSGGGIRSATFCLGLLRALAKNGVLHRFDYLSTVSGGGYIGAMLGRLYQRKPDANAGNALDVEAGLANDGSLLLWWMRNNGRYLLPSGIKDLFQACSGQLRSFVATQFEFMVVCLFGALLVVAPHIFLAWATPPNGVLPVNFSPWFVLAAVFGLVAVAACYGYWLLEVGLSTGLLLAVLCALIGGWLGSLGWQAFHAKSTQTAVALFFASGLLLPAIVGWPWSLICRSRDKAVDVSRLRFTNVLSMCLTLTVGAVILGGLDMVSWFLRYELLGGLGGHNPVRLSWGIGWTSLLVIVARAIAPVLSSRDKTMAAGLPVETLGNSVGLALILAVGIAWLGVYQALLLPNDAAVMAGHPQAYLYAPVLLFLGLVVVFITGNKLQQLNLSSLHFFYRSRIARAYVSVGNHGQSGQAEGARFPVSPLVANTRTFTERTLRVTEQLPSDDTPFLSYVPHRFGGPIHLINCCINQTRDDRTGLFNADRKGVNLTLSALGVETGAQQPESPADGVLAKDTLAQWIAISGAAVASGMGSNTKPGIAVMTFLSGFRLGYWTQSLIQSWKASRLGLAKYRSLLREMFAQFPGLGARYWYVSDGGHFDNTGVYALLKRRVSVIVLADCGADPDYRFGDLQNLVRKARIDYDVIIEFIDPESLPSGILPKGHCFGTPTSIQAHPGSACLVLARILYPGSQQCGTLLVVKPRVSEDLDLDVVSYSDRNPSFPQQSTVNQFFSEEEWESYCTLGLSIGRRIDAAMLAHAPGWTMASAPASASTLTPEAGPAAIKAQGRRKVVKAVGTSLGAGVLLTTAVAAWQAWQGYRTELEHQRDAFNDAVSAAWGVMPAGIVDFSSATTAGFSKLQQYVRTYGVNSDQESQLGDVIARLEQLCGGPHVDDKDRQDCQNQAARLDYTGDDSDRSSTEALAVYTNWPVRNTLQSTSINTTMPAQAVAVSAPAPSDSAPVVARAAVVSDLSPAVMTGGASPSAPGAAPAPVPAPPPQASPVPPSSESLATAGARPPSGPVANTPEKAVVPESRVDASGQVAASCAMSEGRPFTLYTQVYDESARDPVSDIVTPLRALGVAVPGVENVAATATRAGRRKPSPWGQVTLIYSPGGDACASALKTYFAARWPSIDLIPMPGALKGSSSTIELWVPNAAVGDRSRAAAR